MNSANDFKDMFSSFPDLMTAKDLQYILNFKRSKIYALLKSGAIRSMRIGAEYRVPKTFLIEFLNQSV